MYIDHQVQQHNTLSCMTPALTLIPAAPLPNKKLLYKPRLCYSLCISNLCGTHRLTHPLHIATQQASSDNASRSGKNASVEMFMSPSNIFMEKKLCDATCIKQRKPHLTRQGKKHENVIACNQNSKSVDLILKKSPLKKNVLRPNLHLLCDATCIEQCKPYLDGHSKISVHGVVHHDQQRKSPMHEIVHHDEMHITNY